MWKNVRREDPEFRHDTRFSVDYYAAGKHRHAGEIVLHVVDISCAGVKVDEKAGVERGDRLALCLPSGKEVEVICLWTWHQKAGLLFDRPLSGSELLSTVEAMKALSISKLN